MLNQITPQKHETKALVHRHRSTNGETLSSATEPSLHIYSQVSSLPAGLHVCTFMLDETVWGVGCFQGMLGRKKEDKITPHWPVPYTHSFLFLPYLEITIVLTAFG